MTDALLRSVRCPGCGRLLAKVSGAGTTVEFGCKCSRNVTLAADGVTLTTKDRIKARNAA